MKKIRNISIAVGLLLMLWLVWSFIEVNMYNVVDPASISRYNAFKVITSLS